MQKLFTRATTLLAILTLLVPVTVLAQTSRTQGAITGTVTDTQGAALPGVTVTVSSPNLQGSRTEVTDADGKFTIPALAPGDYRAEFTLAGVKNQVREGIKVHAGQVTSANAQMSLSVTETVTVTASQVVVDPTTAATQHTMDEDHLKYTAVGSANRSYQNVLQQAPGVAGGANPNVAGANSAQNDWYVDGVNTTDPVTHTFGGNMAFDAIQEISVLTFGKDAEYKSSGGTVNVITKSGGNEFSGSFDYRYNDPDFLTEGEETRPSNPATGAYYGGPTTEVLRFNKAIQTDKSEQPQATLGGPIMRDRLWFFGATHKPETAQQSPNINGFTPGTRGFNGWNTHGKLTFTPLSNQTFTGKFTDSHALVTNTQSAPGTATSSSFRPEADAKQFQKSRIYALAYDAVLSSKWLANFQVSHRPAELTSSPMSGDIDTIGFTNTPTGVRSQNYTNFQSRTSERNEILASTTYYLERFGTHAFKIGANLDHNEFTNFNWATGNLDTASNRPAGAPTCAQLIAQHGLPAGSICTAIGTTNPTATIPMRLTIGIRNPPTTKEADMTSFFVQDEWRPIPRLTARLGVRYDATSWGSSSGNPIPDFELIQPRVGLAYDVFNNASTVIHAYGGKIGDENQLTLPNFATIEPSVSLRYNQNAAGAWILDTNPQVSFVSLTGHTIDPDLKPSYSNQYSFGITQRVFRNTSIDITAEQRTGHDLFEDYGCKFTSEEECNFFMTNHPGADAGIDQPIRSKFVAVITKIESRPTNWLDMTLSWTHAKSRASTTSTQNQDGSFDYYDDRPCPANNTTMGNCFSDYFTNTYGYTGDDARDRVKLNGYARLPWQFTLGASFQWDSGTAWSVTRGIPGPLGNGGTLFLEPRGSRRLPHFNQLDLQLQKDFTISRFKFGLIGSVFNVLGTEYPIAINGVAGNNARWNNVNDPSSGLFIDPNQVSGTARLSPTFAQRTSWQRPRRYEAGVRFEF